MMSIASDLAKSNLEKLINASLEQSRYICCFTCITGDFEKERKNLIAKKETLEDYVRVANRRSDNIRRDVTLWQKQATDLIEEDTRTKVTCFFGWLPNCKWLYSRGKDLESKTKEIRKLMERNFENVGIARDVPDIEYHSSENYISFKSRELKFEELFNALTDDNNYVIGLQGMGGTGKTTLAKEVGKELKKSKFFDQVIDTTISNTPDTKKIQDDIAGPLGLSLKDYTASERPRRLWDRLTNGEKILVILDDVWGDISFEEIGIPFRDNHNGCRILVTTRSMSTCNKMGCEKIIQLEILPEEEGWILFKKHAGLSDGSSKSILDKGHKISKECKGLPIAIAVIAGSLKGERRLKEWDVALKSLQKSMPLHGGDENWSKVYTCLKYSYDNMKNKTAKKLFLLCSMFREDEEIPQEDLVTVAIGAGLIEQIDDDYSYDACRNEVILAKYELIDSCLLLNCEYGTVKMHDLVREVALSIANKEILTVNTCNKNEMTMVEKGKNIKYLLCEGKSRNLFSSKFDGSKLEILILYINEDVAKPCDRGYVEVPNSFFENIPGLRVLYLLNTSNSFRNLTLSLPLSIQSLTNIRSLYLEKFILGDISILGILKSLQTLELVSCSMDELPREISKLGKLKLLKLNYCYIERKNEFEVIETCTSLEELTLICGAVTHVRHNVKLSDYQKFCILDSNRIWKSREWLERNSLSIFMADEVFSEETFKNLAQKAEVLYLNGLGRTWKSLIPDIICPDDEGMMTNLVEIFLQGISTLPCLIDNTNSRVQNAFELLKNLEKLFLFECIHLEGTLFKSKISLCNLKELNIFSCPMLTSLFELSTTQNLPLLDTIWIFGCEQLKSIVRDESERKDSGGEIVDAHDDSILSIFPNLTFLGISNCPHLHYILPVTAAPNVPKLANIEISNCDELKYLFGPYQHKHKKGDLDQKLKDVIFPTLEWFLLEDLPNFVDIFPECDESMSSSVNRSSSIDESKAQVESKPMKCKILHWIHKYTNKWRTTKIPLDSHDQLQDSSLSMVNDHSNANDVIAKEMTVQLKKIALMDTPQMIFTLQNVTVLLIEGCEKTEVIFSASVLECLPYLHTLAISRCNEIKQIIGEDAKNQRKPFFPRLKVLVITQCNKLKYVFPISTSKMLPKLEVVVIIEACMLEEVFQRDSDQTAEIPNIKTAVFVELPSLCQESEFLTVKDCLVKNCPKLSLSSSLQSFQDILNSLQESNLPEEFLESLRDLFKAKEICNEKSTTESTKDSAIGTQVEAALFEGIELTSSHNNANQSTHAEIDEDDQREDELKQSKESAEEEQQMVVKALGFGIPSMAISPTDTTQHKRHSSENDEGQLIIPSSNVNMEAATTKDVNYGDFKGASDSVVTHSGSTDVPGSDVTNQCIKNILQETLDDLREDPKTREISNQNEMTKAIEDFPIDTKAQVGSELTSSKCLEEIVDQSNQEHSISEKSLKATLSSHPKARETPPEPVFTPPQKEIKRSFEEGTTSKFAETIALSTGSESEHGAGQISLPSFSTVNKELFDTKNVGVGDIQKASNIENLSQISEDSSFSSVITRELEKLVSNKHLALENLSMLADFLVKQPSVCLTDNKLSDRCKGFAYTCLAELLKFLQTHSVLDVLGSSHSEFVELLQDVRRFSFDRVWLDGVERRALFPGLLLSEDALQKLSQSKLTLIQHLEDVKGQMEVSLTQQEKKVQEVKATLSTPLGY